MTDQIESTESTAQESVDTSATGVGTSDSANTPQFSEQFSDTEIKQYIEKAGYKDINGLAKSMMHAEKKLGSPREEESFKDEDYTYELPEDYTPNEDILNPIKEKAVELGIKPDAFKALVETFVGKESEIISQLEQSQQDQQKEVQDSLKKEWGNEYEAKLEQADKTWRAFAPEEADKMLSQMKPEQQLAIAKIMTSIGDKVSEPLTGQQKGNSLLTKEQAEHSIQNIMNDREHPYHLGDPKAINEFFELQKVAVGKVD
jgi:hypothetical protein